MVGSRGWTVLTALGLLGLLCGCGSGQPVPEAFAERPVPSIAATASTVVVGATVVPVRGSALTSSGTAVSGVAVVLRRTGCDGCRVRLVARTDGAGRFAVAVPPGEYRIACATRGPRPCRFEGPGRLDLPGPVADLRLTVRMRPAPHPR